jgi:hypothetical protein
MNFFLKLITNILIFVFALVSFFYHNYDYGWEITFFEELTLFLPIIILIMLGVKSFSRWKKLNLFKNHEGYKLSNSGWKKAVFNETLPFYFYIPLGLILLTYVSYINLFLSSLVLIMLESGFFLVKGRNNFKIVISNQSIIIAHNRQHFIFWNKVKSISFQYGGAMIILNNNKQYYINESDFLSFNKWKKAIKNEAILKEIYVED